MTTSEPSPVPAAQPPRAGRAPVPLLVAVSLVGLEAVLLVVLGVLELTALSGARATMGVTTSVFFVVYAGGLAFCCRALLRRESWARAPVVLAQLIQLGVAWSFRGGDGTVAAVVLAVVAVLVVAGIFHPASLAALAEPDDGPTGPAGDDAAPRGA